MPSRKRKRSPKKRKPSGACRTQTFPRDTQLPKDLKEALLNFCAVVRTPDKLPLLKRSLASPYTRVVMWEGDEVVGYASARASARQDSDEAFLTIFLAKSSACSTKLKDALLAKHRGMVEELEKNPNFLVSRGAAGAMFCGPNGKSCM